MVADVGQSVEPHHNLVAELEQLLEDLAERLETIAAGGQSLLKVVDSAIEVFE